MKKYSPIIGGLIYAAILSTPVNAADFLVTRIDEADILVTPVNATNLEFRQNTSPQDFSPCAVSGLNGKLEGAGGFIKDESIDDGRFFGTGSLSIPLGCEFGFQIDGAAGELGSASTRSIAGHLFTRDPSSYLLGIYGEYTEIGDNNIGRLALEAERYQGRFTLSGVVGYEDSTTFGEDVFGAAQIRFYATDNFQLNIGVDRFLEVTAGTIGAEWQFEDTNVSVFAFGSAGSKDYATVFAGIRWYFGGEQKSLIRRHREDDPVNWIARLQRLADTPPPPAGEGAGPE